MVKRSECDYDYASATMKKQKTPNWNHKTTTLQ